MARYFPGRKTISKVIWESPKGISFICDITEYWSDIGGSVARCGEKGTITLTKSIGLSQKYSQVITGSLEASVGLESIFGLKASISESLGFEVNWEHSEEISISHEFTAPDCGIQEETAFQLFREYDITYTQKRIFRENRVERKIIVEALKYFDFLFNKEEPFEECCTYEEPELESLWDGFLVLNSGRLEVIFPFKKIGEIANCAFPNGVYELENNLIGAGEFSFPSEYLSEGMRFLPDIHEDFIDVTVDIITVSDIIGEEVFA